MRDFLCPGADAGISSGVDLGNPERVTEPEPADGFDVFIDPV
ncbi:MAG: hypothetical protein ACRED2_14615 [Methylocella sp.]